PPRRNWVPFFSASASARRPSAAYTGIDTTAIPSTPKRMRRLLSKVGSAILVPKIPEEAGPEEEQGHAPLPGAEVDLGSPVAPHLAQEVIEPAFEGHDVLDPADRGPHQGPPEIGAQAKPFAEAYGRGQGEPAGPRAQLAGD